MMGRGNCLKLGKGGVTPFLLVELRGSFSLREEGAWTWHEEEKVEIQVFRKEKGRGGSISKEFSLHSPDDRWLFWRNFFLSIRGRAFPSLRGLSSFVWERGGEKFP